ncbi:hypothetical protein U1707_14435 [Sphingomonas sp. PB2P12]|uniref:hypothetical protein n=1 Tax=Sphingomonas sandaracina TaxID=3096157 RepID=UPI002FCBB218
MRADTKPRPTEPACSFETFLSALNNSAPAFAGTPRTLRSHVGARQFGDFGTVLMAERPASFDLSKRVERWRGIDMAREDLPLRAHPDQTADDRRFNVLFVLTPAMILIMVLAGLFSAWWKGVI